MKCRNNNGCGTYVAAIAVGVLLAIMLPPWVCVMIVCIMLAFICFV